MSSSTSAAMRRVQRSSSTTTHRPRSQRRRPRNDYFPGLDNGNPVNAVTQPGFGPNTRVLMRFNVVAATAPRDQPLTIDTSTNLTAGIDRFLTTMGKYRPRLRSLSVS